MISRIVSVMKNSYQISKILKNESWRGFYVDRIDQECTGLKYDVLVVSDKYFYIPVIKVVGRNYHGVVFTVKAPRIVRSRKSFKIDFKTFAQISRWIRINKSTLIDYWKGKTSTSTFLNELKSI